MVNVKKSTYNKGKKAVSKSLSKVGSPKKVKKVKRAVNANKKELAVLGAVLATVATGIGVVGTVVAKRKKKGNKYQERIDELETENQRLEAVLLSVTKPKVKPYEPLKSAEVLNKEDVDYGFVPPSSEEDALAFDAEFFEFVEGVTDSLVNDGDALAPKYEPNETIQFSETDFLNEEDYLASKSEVAKLEEGEDSKEEEGEDSKEEDKEVSTNEDKDESK